jgi:flavin-dependent dehydrogenase
VEQPGDRREEIDASVVVDASGQTALVSRQLGLKEQDPLLLHAAVFTRYRGAWRGTGIDEGATLVLRCQDPQRWFWYIPLPDDEVSVGVVGPIGPLLGGRKGDLRSLYDEEEAQCPALLERIAGATRTMEIRVLRDYSYVSRRIAGDGWIMAGDAFGFLDPIYSTGLLLALHSAELAADAIQEAFERQDFSAARLGAHGARYLAGMEDLRKLVYAYYDPAFRISQFIRGHEERRAQVANLLMGNVFRRPVDGLFEALAGFTRLPEARKLANDGEDR